MMAFRRNQPRLDVMKKGINAMNSLGFTGFTRQHNNKTEPSFR